MRISTSYLLNNLSRDIARQLARMQRLSEDISTTKRVRKPSDDPIAASRGLAIRALRAGVAQHKANIDDARDWLGATEQALVKAQQVFENAADAAIRAGNDALSDDERHALAQDVDGLISELVDLANTQYDGRYIFAGLKTLTRPFVLSDGPGIPSYVVTYEGADGAKRIEVEPGTTMQVNTNGGEVFMQGIAQAGARDLFEILVDLRDHLLAGGQSPTFHDDIASDIAATQAAQDRILNEVTSIGAKARRLDRASESLARDEVELAALLSKAEDADVFKAIADLQLQETVYRAALNAAAGLMQVSLVDFLR
ncbi:MAG: flagellar hook-associated protein FlgL [Firmicutes bacterium]|nr:flagellar hook-associated protein FlgL [Bacillota bacterium]MDH7496658.1 flagellar hook-associated protein FlgL [Bacillota bacterium]